MTDDEIIRDSDKEMEDYQMAILQDNLCGSERVEEVMGLRSSAFAPKEGGPGFPYSRDFALEGIIECALTDCVANSKGKCAMPSCIKINALGRCKGYHKRG